LKRGASPIDNTGAKKMFVWPLMPHPSSRILVLKRSLMRAVCISRVY